MSTPFSPEQKYYLEGFLSGAQAMRTSKTAPQHKTASPALTSAGNQGPDRPHLDAQDQISAQGGRLADQEKWKRAEHPFDAYERFRQQAKAGLYPKPDDNFRWRYHGVFYVAPAQESYMCRMRIPNGILKHWQLRVIADVAQTYGGGYAHITTRANLQIREIKAEVAPDVLEELAEAGIVSKGSGADNIRNVTGSATAGIDAQELIDTRPHARAWHHHILNDRTLYGLPRKFNVSFDGGGLIPSLEDTNDIGFQAVRVTEGAEITSGIWYRLALGGITGHGDLARDTGVVVAPDDAVAVADAIVRVFIAHGDRTNRNKARLKYLLDSWGFDRFLSAVEEQLGRKLSRIDGAYVAPRPAHDRLAHIGVHPQRQQGLNWIGVWTPLGKMTSAQMRDMADLAHRFGDGDVRLTVWQNCLISGVADQQIEAACAAIHAAGLSTDVSKLRAGLVACTGSRGCKFAASDTKGDALRIADHVDAVMKVDLPINIHLTGCHHSCAQHYIGDIGLIGTKVTINDQGDQLAGYHLHVGGGFGAQGAIGRLLQSNVYADDVPKMIEALLRAWLLHRLNASESFQAFTARHDVDRLKQLAELA